MSRHHATTALNTSGHPEGPESVPPFQELHNPQEEDKRRKLQRRFYTLPSGFSSL